MTKNIAGKIAGFIYNGRASVCKLERLLRRCLFLLQNCFKTLQVQLLPFMAMRSARVTALGTTIHNITYSIKPVPAKATDKANSKRTQAGLKSNSWQYPNIRRQPGGHPGHETGGGFRIVYKRLLCIWFCTILYRFKIFNRAHLLNNALTSCATTTCLPSF
jgi:hypothetical protein